MDDDIPMKKKRRVGFGSLGSCLLVLVWSVFLISGCGGEKEPDLAEKIVGSWNRVQSRAYILFNIRANGSWVSDIRIEGRSSRIVEKKGSASGTWVIEDKILALTVVDSDIQDVWEKNSALLFEVVEIGGDQMILKSSKGREIVWTRSQVTKPAPGAQLPPVIKMAPLVVNLNKIRSHDKDRYLCLALELHLNELASDAPLPVLHPRARDAVLIYLGSLIYRDVKTFDKVKKVKKEIEAVMAPYLEGRLKEIKINQVIIAADREKVDEFLVEHTPIPEPEPVPQDEEKKDN